MRFSRVLIAPVLAAVLWTVAAAPLLPSSGGGLMPCCEGGDPCDTALQASGCCRIDAASERAVGLAPAVSQSRGSSKSYLPPATALAASGAMTPAPVPTPAMTAGGSPPHAAVVPLYLLHGALLR